MNATPMNVMPRKLIAGAFAVFLALGLGACGDEDGDGATTDEEVGQIDDAVDEGADQIQDEIDEGQREAE